MRQVVKGQNILLDFSFLNEPSSPFATVFDIARTLVCTVSLTKITATEYTAQVDTSPVEFKVGYNFFTIASGLKAGNQVFANSSKSFKVIEYPYDLRYIDNQELADWIGISVSGNEYILNILTQGVTDFVSSFCKRRFNIESYSEVQLLGPHKHFFLQNYPIVTTPTVKHRVTETVFEVEWYDPATGLVSFESSLTNEATPIDITYQAGFTALPEDLRISCLKIGAMLWNKKKNEGLSSERILSYSYSLQSVKEQEQEVLTILKYYRKVI